MRMKHLLKLKAPNKNKKSHKKKQKMKKIKRIQIIYQLMMYNKEF